MLCCLQQLEECPICLLNYPALNTTRCCCKGICTECYLQVWAPPFPQLLYGIPYQARSSARTSIPTFHGQRYAGRYSHAAQVQSTSAIPHTCFCPYCKATLHVAYRGPRSAAERSQAKLEQQRVFEAILKARLVGHALGRACFHDSEQF